jgi:hypothetical protein
VLDSKIRAWNNAELYNLINGHYSVKIYERVMGLRK